MTAPRQILPGTTYLLTRRCSERRLFLRPSEETNQLFLYVLGVAAQRHRVQVHVAGVLSNHYHLLATDPFTELPRFMQYLDSLVVRATNSSIGHWEGFWSSDGSYSAVTPVSPDDTVGKGAYILANPVAAGLVQHGREWPGVWTPPEQFGTTLRVKRPDWFFSKDGDMPEEVALTLTAPPSSASVEEFRDRVAAATGSLEAEHRREAQAQQRRFLGRVRVLAQSPCARPAPGEPRRGLNPRVAARDKWKRIEALARLESFLSDYLTALTKYRAGKRDAVFPRGTYLLRVHHGVRCAAA